MIHDQQSSQFLHILAAEAEDLISVSIKISDDARFRFVNTLIQAVSSDGYSAASQLWNEVRVLAVTETVDDFLLSFGAKWVREWLREEEEEALAEKCGQILRDVRKIFQFLGVI